MTIYLHPRPVSTLAEAYDAAFSSATEIFVLSAFLRDWRNFKIAPYCKNATLVVGKDFGITRKKALSEALTWKRRNNGICHFLVANQIDGFHPKLVMWKQRNGCYLIVGSSNLTIAAFQSNYEANIRLRITDKRYVEISNWIADILALSRPVTKKWIDEYQESANTSRPHTSTPAQKTMPVGKLTLPRFPSLAQAIAERKEKACAFEDIRSEFEAKVRACHSGKVDDSDFYEWLKRNWNTSDWKFQGSGIFRRPATNTTWRLLCGALVKCLDSTDTNRDHMVQVVYDELEELGKTEARKSFLTEMLCHFYPKKYPIWNTPVETWLKKAGLWQERKRGLSAGEKYMWLANQLRLALRQNFNYPAQDLAELDHAIWAYCKYKRWLQKR